MALDYGIRGTKAALCLYGTLSKPLFGDRLCPRCTSLTAGLTYIQHLCVCHPDLELDKLCDMIKASNSHNNYQHRPETNEIFASLLVCLFTVL